MWLLNKAKAQLQIFADNIKTTADKVHPPMLSHPLYTTLDALIQQDSNIVPLADLQQLSKRVSCSPDDCLTLAQILFYKLQRYQPSRSRGLKLFKTLVICDYLLLNGVSAFIDVFRDRVQLFECIAQEQSSEDEELKEAISRKAQHIQELLLDKEKRLAEKECLQQARLLIIKSQPISIQRKIEAQSEGHKQSEKSKQQKKDKKKIKGIADVEKFLTKKLEHLAVLLIGLLDGETLSYIDSERNKEFMEKGESIIQQVQPQITIGGEGTEKKEKQEENAKNQSQKEQTTADRHKKQSQEQAVQKKPQHENLLGLQIELL